MRNTISKRITIGIIILAESALISAVSGIGIFTIMLIILPLVVVTKLIHDTIKHIYKSVM